MRSKRTSPPLVVILAGLLTVVAFGTATAGDDDGFTLALDPILLRPFFVDVDTDSAKWEEYRDVSQDMTFPLIFIEGASGDGNRYLDFTAENVNRADARYTLNYGQSGSYSLMVDYNVIPHRFVNSGTLPWSRRIADNVFAIADPTQGYLQGSLEDRRAAGGSIDYEYLQGLTAPFFDVADLVDVRLERKRTGIRLDLAKMSKFGLGVEVKHERRDGGRPYAGTFGFSNVLELIEPIDYETTSIEVSGETTADRGGLQFGYRYSMFDNENLGVMYDNPFRVTDSTDGRAYTSPGNSSINGPKFGANALPPDNRSNMLWVSGRARLGDDGWVNGSFNFNNMKQDEPFLPYSTNSAINPSSGAPFDVTDPGNLPASNANNEATSINFKVAGGTKLGDMADVKASWRMYDYDNKSVNLQFPGYVRMDGVWEDIPRQTVQYDFRRNVFEVSAGFDVGRASNLSVGYTRDAWNRDFREVEDVDDNILSVNFDHRMNGRVNFNARYEYGKRNISEYRTEAQEVTFINPEGINNQPGLRKFDQAERNSHAFRVLANLMAADALDFVVGFNLRNEDYPESLFGLNKDNSWEFNLELNYNPQPDLGFFVYGSYHDREVFQRARQSGGTLSTDPRDDWEATFDEKTNVWGGGLNARFAERWLLDLTAQWTDADGTADLFSPPGGRPDEAMGFENYDDSELVWFKARLGWDFNQHIDAGIGYWYERYKVSRFGVDGIEPYSPGSVLLAGNDGDYEANVFTLDMGINF